MVKFENATVIVEKRTGGVQPAIFIVENGDVKLITITPDHNFDITDEGKLGDRWDISGDGKVKWCENKKNPTKIVHFESKQQMINFIMTHPHVKVKHMNFDSSEYIYSKPNGNVYDEIGYLFEDWESEGPGQHNGIRMRDWETGWYYIEE